MEKRSLAKNSHELMAKIFIIKNFRKSQHYKMFLINSSNSIMPILSKCFVIHVSFIEK